MNGSGIRSLTALYVAAPFSMGYVDFYTFLMPLYALSLGFDAAEVGILVGARSIVAMFLSIHIGVLMDRFGTRKITLFSVWASMVLAPLFPLVPWFWSLLVLQLVNGAAGADPRRSDAAEPWLQTCVAVVAIRTSSRIWSSPKVTTGS